MIEIFIQYITLHDLKFASRLLRDFPAQLHIDAGQFSLMLIGAGRIIGGAVRPDPVRSERIVEGFKQFPRSVPEVVAQSRIRTVEIPPA